MIRETGFVFLLIVAFCAADFAHAQEADSIPTRERAIELARAGEFDAALQMFKSLRAQDPVDMELLYDETTVLAWASYDQRAFENTRLIDFRKAPDYMIRPLARSARNLGRFDRAARWYAILVERNSEDMDARRGLAMALADGGRYDEAWEAIDAIPADQRNTVQMILTEAYLYERERRFLEALAAYQRMAEIDPGNREGLRGEALMLRAVLLPRQALALARENPGILTADEVVNLEADVAAIQIRLGAQSYYPDSRRYEGTDLALGHVSAMLQRDDIDPGMRQRLQFDRIVALTNRKRTREAISEFEALDVSHAEMPAYVLASAGRAYLNERRPDDARKVLERAVANDPTNFHIKFQLFFAYTDLREADLAADLADELLSSLPEANRVPGSRVIKGNDDYLRAAIMFGLARAYFDQLEYSQKYFEDLLARAPHNTDIRHELANVYRWRGWLDRSRSEYAQVLAIEPELMSARIGNAHANLDNRDYAQVKAEVLALTEYHWDEPAVRNLADRWNVHNRQELIADAEFGESSGSTFGDNQYRVDLAWYSSPLNDNWRATLFTHDAYARFPEGNANRQRVGAGVEYRHKRWLANLNVSSLREGGETGVDVSANYRHTDHWSFGASYETASNSTPLRGQRVGITSNMATVSAVYTRHESADIRAQLGYQELSDDNDIVSFLIRGQRRLFNTPSQRLTAIAEAYADDHARSDVVYFSPQSGFSWSAGLRYEWLMARRYDFGLTHTVIGEIGQYNQSGFAADQTWGLNYEFRADLNRRFSTHIGFSRRQNVYDGNREHGTFVLGGLRWRF
ncbi:MAG: poly-beta-1,6 N-acetyl-D-glucosamine export porin PgaA [Gammaproteobacteria bacterium]|nr:poly-beta-1,6 N-acetyl-D-glucosamine export porin PgaA [Gammaproteobacteria bacterium]